MQRVAEALLKIHDLPASAFGDTRAMNLPSLSVTIGEMVAAVERRNAGGRIAWRRDPVLQAIADDWPKRFVSERASKHGIGADASIDEVIEHFLRG